MCIYVLKYYIMYFYFCIFLYWYILYLFIDMYIYMWLLFLHMMIYGNVSNTWYASDHPNVKKTFGTRIPISWLMSLFEHA